MNTKHEIELLKKKVRTPEQRKVYTGGDKRLHKLSHKLSMMFDVIKSITF